MGSIGIVSYGAYLPRYRLNRAVISKALEWLNPGGMTGEKAVSNFDEDSLTMAVAACINATDEIDRRKIEGVYFASTTAPYYERESAAIISTVLNLNTNVRTCDFGGALKSGTAALLAALDYAKGEGGNMLVCATDCRLGKPGSPAELLFGDGAGAVTTGNENPIAVFEGAYSSGADFPDFRRSEGDKFVRTSEERFIRDEGFAKIIPEVVHGLLKKLNLTPKDINKAGYACAYAKDHAALGKKMGFELGQIQAPLLAVVGELGTATPLVTLSAMLDEAKPGDKLLLASFGNGADALVFTVTEEINKLKNRTKLSKCLAAKKELTSYEKYLVFRGILPIEIGVGQDIAPTQLPLAWRERKTILALCGTKCKKCGTPQYPPQRICVNPKCGAVNEMEPYRFADRKGKVFSFTEDYTAASISPPLMYSVIDFEGGGRFMFELTDCESGSVKTGTSVHMSLRHKYHDKERGIHGYFWKAVPVIE